MKELGKLLVALGLVSTLLGAWIWKHNGLGFLDRLGKLPGDIHFQKGPFNVHFPVVTCLVLSLLLTLLQWLLRKS